MENISAVDNDESFAMLYGSIDLTTTSNMDELTEVEFLLGKLASVIDKQHQIGMEMAVEIDTMQTTHHDQMASLEMEHNAMNHKLEEMLLEFKRKTDIKDADLNAASEQNQGLKLLVFSIHKRK